jgi:signal transduction histidine kinase
MTALLETFATLLAVLNAQRQVVAVNRPLLERLGVRQEDLRSGLRPGEALGCVHAEQAPEGCGTGTACLSCGAAIAITTSGAEGRPAVRECLLATVGEDGATESREFRVRAVPMVLGESQYTLLSLEDIREQKLREALERVFFHDVLNELQALTGLLELVAISGPEAAWERLPRMERLALRISRELQSQRDLSLLHHGDYQLRGERVTVAELWRVLEGAFDGHRVARGRRLVLDPASEPLALETDRGLLERVLENMAKNALEAVPQGAEVHVGCAPTAEGLRFACWNPGAIPAEVVPRIFQRFFSTKGGTGRGLGTYSMKLLGERYLGGRVGFTTGPEGTTFTLDLPRGG